MDNSQQGGAGAATAKLTGPDASRSAVYDGFRAFLDRKVKAIGPVEVRWNGETIRALGLETDGRLYAERNGVREPMDLTPGIVSAILEQCSTGDLNPRPKAAA